MGGRIARGGGPPAEKRHRGVAKVAPDCSPWPKGTSGEDQGISLNRLISALKWALRGRKNQSQNSQRTKIGKSALAENERRFTSEGEDLTETPK